jgi:hypothetical protein
MLRRTLVFSSSLILSATLITPLLALKDTNANAQIKIPDVDSVRIKPPPIWSLSPRPTPCSQFLQTHFDWAKNPRQSVGVSVAFNNSEGRLVTYSTGALRRRGNSLTGELEKLLSDRVSIVGAVPGEFSSGKAQRFDALKPASVGLTITDDGLITWVENSFNNQSSTYRAVCYTNETVILFGMDHSGVMTLGKGPTDPH